MTGFLLLSQVVFTFQSYLGMQRVKVVSDEPLLATGKKNQLVHIKLNSVF